MSRLLLLLALVSLLQLFAVSSLRAEFAISGLSQYSEIVPSFGFGAGGQFELSASVHPSTAKVYVIVVRKQLWEHYLKARANGLLQDFVFCTMPSTLRYEVDGMVKVNSSVDYRHQYVVLAVTCTGHPSILLNGSVSLLNPDPSSSTHFTHLPVEFEHSASIYFGLAFAYCGATLYFLFRFWSNREMVHRVHWGGIGALLAKLMQCLLTYGYYEALAGWGIVPFWLQFLARAFDTVSVVFFLGMLLLTSVGVGITRQLLPGRERRILTALFSFYFAVGMLKASCGDVDGACGAFLLTEYVVRSLIMLGIIVSLNFNITNVRAIVQQGNWRPDTAFLYTHVIMFRVHRWAFLCYLLLPTLELIVQYTVLSWDTAWLSQFTTETLLFLVYVTVTAAYRFKPFHGFTAIGDIIVNGVRPPPADSPPLRFAFEEAQQRRMQQQQRQRHRPQPFITAGLDPAAAAAAATGSSGHEAEASRMVAAASAAAAASGAGDLELVPMGASASTTTDGGGSSGRRRRGSGSPGGAGGSGAAAVAAAGGNTATSTSEQAQRGSDGNGGSGSGGSGGVDDGRGVLDAQGRLRPGLPASMVSNMGGLGFGF